MGFNLSSKFQEVTSSKQSGAGGGYLNPSKIPDGGSVKFHITSEEELGFWELWAEDKDGNSKPFRFDSDPSADEIEAELGKNYSRRMNREGTGVEPPKFCAAFAVFDYDTESIKVMQLSQRSLQNELSSIAQDEDFSDFDNVDFKLSREGKMLETRYVLRPISAKPGNRDKAMAAMERAVKEGFDINRLLKGGNPFKED